jgi:hypothetical protein
LEGKLYFIPHPLFHILLILFQFVFGSWELSAAVLLIILIGLAFNFQTYFISKELGVGFFAPESVIFSFILLIVSSVYIPPLNNWLSPDYFSVMFSGSGTPNILHNPTYYLVRLFVLPLFYFGVKLLGNTTELKPKEVIFFTVFLTLSIIAKPNFALSFIPAFTILFVLKSYTGLRSIVKSVKILIIILALPLITLFLQFFISYVAGPRDSTVSVCFFCVWINWSKFPPLSILLGIAFPLYMLLLDIKVNLKSLKYRFAWLNFIFALIFGVFFYETDYRLLAGNFFWGYNLALFLLFFVSIIDLIRGLRHSYQNHVLRGRLIGAVFVLVLHIAGGFYHFSVYMH